jgi:hypothetical protein
LSSAGASTIENAAVVSGSAMRAVFVDGPLEGTTLEVEPVGGRPPSTVDAPGGDGEVLRYCLAEWAQAGMSAEYSYLYPVPGAADAREERQSVIGAATQAFADMAKLDAKRQS